MFSGSEERSIGIELMVASGRYVPGTSSSGGSQPPPTVHASTADPYSRLATTTRKHLPQKSYLSFKVGELGVIINKMKTFNMEVPPENVSIPFSPPSPSSSRLNMTDFAVGRLTRNSVSNNRPKNSNLTYDNPTPPPRPSRTNPLLAFCKTFPRNRYPPPGVLQSAFSSQYI